MGIFNKTAAEPETSGTDLLRDATRSRRHKVHLGILARDLHISISDLEAFVDNGKPLPEPVLQALAREFFNAELTEADKLSSVNKAEPRLFGIPSPPFDPNAVTYPPRTDPKASRININPGPPITMPWSSKRPGWL
jgi:hypothetical protein